MLSASITTTRSSAAKSRREAERLGDPAGRSCRAVLELAAEQALEVLHVVAARDEHQLVEAGLPQRLDRVEDHRLVVDGQEVLVRDPRQRIEPRAGAAGEDHALHRRCDAMGRGAGPLLEEGLARAVLSKPRRESPYSKVTVRPVLVDEELRYQFEYRQGEKATHANLPAGRGRDGARRADPPRLPAGAAADARARLPGARRGEGPAAAADREAGRPRARPAQARLLEEGKPVPFLVELGVMTPEGKVRAQRTASSARSTGFSSSWTTCSRAGASDRRLRLRQVVPDVRALPPARVERGARRGGRGPRPEGGRGRPLPRAGGAARLRAAPLRGRRHRAVRGRAGRRRRLAARVRHRDRRRRSRGRCAGTPR